jgi:hypothetical protein|tara:strand:+ start:1276 stop:1731 length:456 start_codon:yes stop_codon:yes gene_type:complete
MNIPIEFNKVYTYTLQNYKIDCLTDEMCKEIFKDGRAFSHFIEPWLSIKFPLIHIKGCKQYDFVNKNDKNIKYDEKTFTKRGCRYMPSNMIGQGREFDEETFIKKASELKYIIVSNVKFPEIKIKFVSGIDLLKKYPNGIITIKHYDEFFR